MSEKDPCFERLHSRDLQQELTSWARIWLSAQLQRCRSLRDLWRQVLQTRLWKSSTSLDRLAPDTDGRDDSLMSNSSGVATSGTATITAPGLPAPRPWPGSSGPPRGGAYEAFDGTNLALQDDKYPITDIGLVFGTGAVRARGSLARPLHFRHGTWG